MRGITGGGRVRGGGRGENIKDRGNLRSNKKLKIISKESC